MDETGSGHTADHSSGHASGQPDDASRPGDKPGRLGLAEINHEEYDALADLFLGDGGFAPDPVGSGGGSDHPEAPLDEHNDAIPTHATHTPVLQLARHEEDAPLDSVLDDQAASAHVLDTLNATDARASELLAELMGEQTAQSESEATVSQTPTKIEFIEMPDPTIEVVVLGHLPVRASLWARQYACFVARELGETIALVRAASGSTSVDLIADGEPISVRTFVHLDGALEAISNIADRVILRVDENAEQELLERPEIEEITILTGDDEAAVVASYRLIKALDATLYEQYVDDEGPTLRVAVMGAGQEQAMDACAKLGNAVKSFIDRPIEIVVGSGRIDATGTTNLYRDSIAHRASDILDGLVQAAQSADESLKLQLADMVQDAKLVEVKPAPIETPAIEPPPDTVPMPEQRVAREESRSKNPDSDGSPTIRDGLCAMIPGLDPIETRCPNAPGVDLASDAQGRLHLIVCDDDTDDPMNRLLAAQSWARNNLGLLIRAEPGLLMPTSDRDIDTDPTMHLISSEPQSIRAIYDTPVRVYALARVKIGQVIAQVATPIN